MAEPNAAVSRIYHPRLGNAYGCAWPKGACACDYKRHIPHSVHCTIHGKVEFDNTNLKCLLDTRLPNYTKGVVNMHTKIRTGRTRRKSRRVQITCCCHAYSFPHRLGGVRVPVLHGRQATEKSLVKCVRFVTLHMTTRVVM